MNVSSRRSSLGDRLLERGRRRDVELAGGGDAGRRAVADDLDAEGRDRHAAGF
jgi:hypothetical protein